MNYDRSSQILLLKKEFSKVKSSGFRPTLFTIPIRSVFGRSKCLLEITVPREYPLVNVSFKMLNPLPHYWADGDLIRCPRELYDKPLVDIVWEVISKFVDYDKYVSGKRLHEDDKATEAKLVESFNILKQDIVKALNNPPTSTLSHINSMSQSQVRQALDSDSEIYKLIYKSEDLNDLLKDMKMRVYRDEQTISDCIRNRKKTENIFSDLQQNITYIENISKKSALNFSLNSNKTVLEALNREIETLRDKISRRKESVYSGRRKYKDVKDDIFILFNKLNTLHTLTLAIECHTG